MATFRCNYCRLQLTAKAKPPTHDRWCDNCRAELTAGHSPQAAVDLLIKQHGLKAAYDRYPFAAKLPRPTGTSEVAKPPRKRRKKPAVGKRK